MRKAGTVSEGEGGERMVVVSEGCDQSCRTVVV